MLKNSPLVADEIDMSGCLDEIEKIMHLLDISATRSSRPLADIRLGRKIARWRPAIEWYGFYGRRLIVLPAYNTFDKHKLGPDRMPLRTRWIFSKIR